MRYYLLFDDQKTTVGAVESSLGKWGDFRGLGIGDPNKFSLEKLNPEPTLVIINLDRFAGDWELVLNRLNACLSFPPHYIGITTNAQEGFKAYKKGFVNVIDISGNNGEIDIVMRNYCKKYNPPSVFPIAYYSDVQYVRLKEVLYLRADDNSTELVLRDGKVITNFKSLRHTLGRMPRNFQRIHNSFAVNCHYVERIRGSKGQVFLRNLHKPLPLSETYYKNVTAIKEVLRDWREVNG